MKLLSSFLLLSFSLVEVTPSLLSIANSVFEWTTDLGSQVPGITPLFTKINGGVALASIVQDDETKFFLNVTTFGATGDWQAICEIPLMYLADRVWNTRLTYLGDSRVALTWLFNDKNKLESALRLTVVYLDDCALNLVTINVDTDVDYVYHVPYAVVPYRDGEFDVFVKSPKICEEGVCKIGFKTYGQEIVEKGQPISFLDDADFLEWTVAPVESYNPFKGFYLFGSPKQEQSTSSIKKLDAYGTILKSAEIKLTGEEIVGYSNSYENFGFCSSTPGSSTVNCTLFDTDLSKKVEVSVPVDAPVRKIGMGNDNDDGFLLLLNSCLNEHCFDHVTVARKISAKGEVRGAEEFARSKTGCFPRNNFDLFVDEKENVYCTGAPCMRKSVNSTAYEVSVHTKCLKNL